MRNILCSITLVLYLLGCVEKEETISTIKGHLIEGSEGLSLANVRVTLYDDAKVYAIVFSDESGVFSMSSSLMKNFYYKLSFHWDNEYPSKVITLINIPETYDMGDIIVYDKTNPYDYKVYTYEGVTYMIHKTLSGLYTFDEAKYMCKSLGGGYEDWMLPPADLMDVIADDEAIANQIAEEGWYWSSWFFNANSCDYYTEVNILKNETAYTRDPSEKLKVLPVRIKKQ